MPKQPNVKRAQASAVAAAKTVGALLRKNLNSPKRANEVTQHDIKLELDVRSQAMIQRQLGAAFPEIPLLGEEGITGDPSSTYRWVVDPIDGTVNFAYSIPHACISIALQGRSEKGKPDYEDGYNTLVGVVYDPFCDELWTAIRGQPAKLNGKVTKVSERRKMAEAVVSIGFAKSRENLEASLPYFTQLVHQIRKIRIMGSAALALTYTASGRFDAYIERGIRLWDIAAGGLILECAGGRFEQHPIAGDYAYQMLASNGILHRKFQIPD
jgi:myo-inositol-1(or 4)-monophosphatase